MALQLSTFIPLLDRVEAAIDAHRSLERQGRSRTGQALFEIDRDIFIVKIQVRLRGTNKKLSPISGQGDTAEEAVEDLIASLNIWTKVFFGERS